MTTRRMQSMLLGLALAGAAPAFAQSTGTGGFGTTGTGGGSGGTTGGQQTGTLNNQPTFDPSLQAAALLLGNYRVPGAPPLEPAGTYRVPSPGGGRGSSTASTGGTASTTTTNVSTTNAAGSAPTTASTTSGASGP